MKSMSAVLLMMTGVLSVAAAAVASNSGLGFDASTPVSVYNFKQLSAAGYNYTILRGYRSKSGGMVDVAGVQSVKDAATAGVTDIGIYIFPSVNEAGRKSPEEQIKEMVVAFEGTSYNRIWLDVEEPNRIQGQYWYPPDAQGSLAKNQIFFEALIAACKIAGKNIGVYSDIQSWGMIMGDNYTAGSAFPLWYARYDKKPSFDGFKAFGGWTQPAMKQFEGDVTVCGVGVDKNWREP